MPRGGKKVAGRIMTFRRRLSTTAREQLYDSEAAKARINQRGELPICNICDTPIDGVRSAWDVSHDPAIPGWLGGAVTGIAHRRCNREHNAAHDTPLFAKTNRVRRRHIGATVAQQPVPGGRDDKLKRKFNGQVVQR